jgi:H+/Cl- antiporter ClcA
VYGLVFAFLSACCVQYISPYIVGSGMPEMKTILSGIKMERVLDFRTMVAKFFGIATTISAGFVVGRVGPFAHIVACMAEQLMKIRLFKRLNAVCVTSQYLF